MVAGRLRMVAILAVPVVVAAGLGSRAVFTGDVAKYLGDALYTVLVYTVCVAVIPRIRPRTAAGVAVGFSWAVEFFQLTGLSAEWSMRSGLARLVLGSTFNAPDLLCYVVGAGAAWAVHGWAGRGPASADAGRRP
ncbi:DUF2809 domain-containing protein [Kitasatospora sp. NBC_01539]|uniref:ribosomal maturation YjgA family protein n=1 Tax=Kitasatospora sp. NBC_01539 TaxID=2903577 RepID=UPI0038600F56